MADRRHGGECGGNSARARWRRAFRGRPLSVCDVEISRRWQDVRELLARVQGEVGWRSMIQPRERRTIIGAGAVLAAAVLFAYGVLPFVRRWSEREDLIAMRASQVARLRWLTAHEAELRQAATDRLTRAVGVGRPRLLAGRSPALAA